MTEPETIPEFLPIAEGFALPAFQSPASDQRAGMSVNRRIFLAASVVTLAGILVKFVALGKEFVVAATFGRSDQMDAFLIGFLVPGLLVNLFSESMNQALIPTLVRVREREGHAQAQKLLSSAMLGTCLLLVTGSVAMAVGARDLFGVVAAGFGAEKLVLAEHLFYGLLPVVLLTGIASNCTAVLNTFERFAWPALAPMVTPIAVIVGALLLTGRCGIWALVIGNVAGALMHMLLMAGMMERSGYLFRLRWEGLTEPLREVAGQYGPVMLSGLVASGGLLVDQGMAARLPAGSVSTLVYGNRFVSVVVMLLAGAVGTAVTPYFSQMVACQDWKACRHTVWTYMQVTAAISITVGVAMMAGSALLVRVALQHGRFGAADTAAVAQVQAMYAFQIPFFVVSRVFYRYLMAIRRMRLILWCGVINLVLDVVLNIVLMRWMGVAGIALATSLWTVSTFLFLGFWCWRLLPEVAG